MKKLKNMNKKFTNIIIFGAIAMCIAVLIYLIAATPEAPKNFEPTQDFIIEIRKQTLKA